MIGKVRLVSSGYNPDDGFVCDPSLPIGEWSDQKAMRRGKLLYWKSHGGLTDSQQSELDALQEAFGQWQEKTHPLHELLLCKTCGAKAWRSPTGWQCAAYSNHSGDWRHTAQDSCDGGDV